MVPIVMAGTGMTVSGVTVSGIMASVAVSVPVAVDHAKACHREEPD